MLNSARKHQIITYERRKRPVAKQEFIDDIDSENDEVHQGYISPSPKSTKSPCVEELLEFNEGSQFSLSKKRQKKENNMKKPSINSVITDSTERNIKAKDQITSSPRNTESVKSRALRAQRRHYRRNSLFQHQKQHAVPKSASHDQPKTPRLYNKDAQKSSSAKDFVEISSHNQTQLARTGKPSVDNTVREETHIADSDIESREKSVETITPDCSPTFPHRIRNKTPPMPDFSTPAKPSSRPQSPQTPSCSQDSVWNLIPETQTTPLRCSLVKTLKVASPSPSPVKEQTFPFDQPLPLVPTIPSSHQPPAEDIFTESTRPPSKDSRVTYARVRSFLEILPGSLRPSFTATPEQFSPEEQDDFHTHASSHELRAAGGTKRLLDELCDLVDGIDSSIPVQRSSLLELSQKLCQHEYLINFRVYHNNLRIFSDLTSKRDPIVCFGLVFIACMLLQQGTFVEKLIYEFGILEFLLRMVEQGADISKEADRVGLSKVARSALKELRTSVQKMIFQDRDVSVLSIRKLAFVCISLVLVSIPDVEEMGLVRKHCIEKCIPCISLQEPLEAQLALRVCELATTGHYVEITESLAIFLSKLLNDLFTASQDYDIGPSEFNSHRVDSLEDMLLLLLRFLINLTGINPKACEQIALSGSLELLTSQIIYLVDQIMLNSDSTVQNLQTVLCERLLLVLGLMINFAEESAMVRQVMCECNISSNSTTACRILQSFMRFLEKSKDSLQDVIGYLGLLLTHLISHSDAYSTSFRAVVIQNLNGLDPLIQVLQGFLMPRDMAQGADVGCSMKAVISQAIDMLTKVYNDKE